MHLMWKLWLLFMPKTKKTMMSAFTAPVPPCTEGLNVVRHKTET